MQNENLNVIHKLDQLIEIFQGENTWIQMDYARDSNGYGCKPSEENACSFCLMGAILKFSPRYKSDQERLYGVLPTTDFVTIVNVLQDGLKRKYPNHDLSIVTFNDNVAETRSEILDFLGEVREYEMAKENLDSN